MSLLKTAGQAPGQQICHFGWCQRPPDKRVVGHVVWENLVALQSCKMPWTRWVACSVGDSTPLPANVDQLDSDPPVPWQQSQSPAGLL